MTTTTSATGSSPVRFQPVLCPRGRLLRSRQVRILRNHDSARNVERQHAAQWRESRRARLPALHRQVLRVWSCRAELRQGAGLLRRKRSGRCSTPDENRRAANYTLGLGLQYSFTRSFAMRTEVERFRISDPVAPKGDIELYSIGLVYKFGRHEPMPGRGSPATATPTTACCSTACRGSATARRHHLPRQ